MKQHFLTLGLILMCQYIFSQHRSKFDLQVNYGLYGNFFVKSYNESGGPDNKVYFYEKNFIGSVSGVNLTYRLSSKSSIFTEYSRSVNIGKKNFEGTIANADIFINDFKLRQINNIFQLGYGYQIKKNKTSIEINAGILAITDAQQLIEIENFDDVVRIDERNYKNANLMEGGVFVGFGLSKKIDTRFRAGIKSRMYYLISTGSLEAISLTPFIVYTL